MGQSRNRHTKVAPTPSKEFRIKKDLSIKSGDGREIIFEPWCPSSTTAFKVLLSARLCAAVWSGITDCDETYNYWEPTHYLMYNKGFQTWEYSPMYALRSYAYLWPQAILGFIYSNLLQPNKILVFYFIRCILGFVCAASELYFFRGIVKVFGPHIGRLCLAFLVFSAGMFISSTAYLPSSFSMLMAMLSFGAWLNNKHELAIWLTAVSAILGWPFAAILGVPIAYHIIIVQRKMMFFLQWSLFALFTVLLPVLAIDSFYYGRLVVAPLNIILYNVFSDHGPDLYGVEPWSYYFLNGFLNFNMVFIAAIVSAPILLLQISLSRRKLLNNMTALALFPMYLWMAIFFLTPHKEERFLFPIYPFICLSASIALDSTQKLISSIGKSDVKKKSYLKSTSWMAVVLVITSSGMSLSRSIALYQGYHAPMEVFLELNRISQEQPPILKGEKTNITVCMGKEWYRFPSNFFMPPDWQLNFLRSEFRGQLPKHFPSTTNATKIIPQHMNDQNREEPSRYIDPAKCDFLVDSDYPGRATMWEPRYALKTNEWQIIGSIPFLNVEKSSRLFRSFYVPYFSETQCDFVDYNILARKS